MICADLTGQPNARFDNLTSMETEMMKTPRSLLLFAAAFGIASAQAAPTLEVAPSGVLLGAIGVAVGGGLYDVSFVDGSCATLFGGCTDTAGFAFRSAGGAQTASQALIDQVLLNGRAGNFLSKPWLANGYSFSPGGPAACSILTAYDVDPSAFDSVALERASFHYGSASPPPPSVDPTSTTAPFLTYAVWTAEPAAPVPEPGAVSLTAAGLVLLYVQCRHA
jgi:hypothetical protein